MKRKPHLTEAQFDKKFEQLRARLNKQVTSTGLLPESVVTIRQSILDDTLLSYQLGWIDDKAQIKIWEKSRRIGASWAEAADAVLHAGARDGANVWYISYNKDMTAGFIQDCVYWVRQFSGLGSKVEEILDDERKDILGYKIRFASGHAITALSSKASNLRSKGKPKEWLIIDEAAFVEDLDGLMKAGIAFLMWGGSIHILSTHNGEDNPFNTLILDTRAGKFDYKIQRTTLAQAVTAGLVKRIFKVIGREWTKKAEADYVKKLRASARLYEEEEFDVIPSQGSGAVLTRAVIERCMSEELPVLRLARKDDFTLKPKLYRETDIKDWLDDNIGPLLDALPHDRYAYFGQDFALNVDLSVITPAVDQPDCSQLVPFILEMRNIPHEQQKQVAWYIIDRLPLFGHAAFDARGNGSYLAQVTQQQYGELAVSCVMPSTKWYMEEMPSYIARFQDGTILLPKDAGVLDDHRILIKNKGVVMVPNAGTKDQKDGGRRHGDSAISGALAEYASKQEIHGDFDFESTGEECASSEDIF